MTKKAQELRSELDARKESERKEAERRSEELRKAMEAEATRLIPMMFRKCIEKCAKENDAGHSEARLTFDGYAAQKAMPGVADKLREENFKVSYSFDSYGFRVNGDGYVISEGTPYVAINISW